MPDTENLPNKDPQITSGPSPPHPRKINPKKLLVALLLVIFTAFCAVLAYKLSNDKELTNTSSVGSFDIKAYKEFESFTVQGTLDKTGMVFTKPKELQVTALDQRKAGYARLAHTGTTDNSGGSRISAASLAVGQPPTEEYLTALGIVLTDPKANGYTASIKPIQDFAAQEFDGYDIKLGTPAAAPTPKITKHIWQTDFTAKADGKDDAGQDFKGKAILAVSGKAYYYFIVSAVGPVWDKTKDTWTQVINSLTLDQ